MIGALTKLIKTIIMLKNILKLEGAQKLTKNEQKAIKGGIHICYSDGCSNGRYCCKWGCQSVPCYE
jgi:hypothetical protein